MQALLLCGTLSPSDRRAEGPGGRNLLTPRGHLCALHHTGLREPELGGAWGSQSPSHGNRLTGPLRPLCVHTAALDPFGWNHPRPRGVCPPGEKTCLDLAGRLIAKVPSPSRSHSEKGAGIGTQIAWPPGCMSLTSRPHSPHAVSDDPAEVLGPSQRGGESGPDRGSP